MNFVNAVKGYAGDRTFRQFLTDNGFNFPTNNQSSYWLLGFESDGYIEVTPSWGCPGYRAYSSYIAKNHSFYSVSVNLDTKISDFAKNPQFKRIQYFAQVAYEIHNTSCGKYDYTSFKNPIIVESDQIGYEPKEWSATGISSDGKNYASNIVKYYTIGNIGKPVTGTVDVLNAIKYWS